MCGRYSFNITRARFETVYQTQLPLEFDGRASILPTDLAPMIRAGMTGLEASLAYWGFKRPPQHGPRPIINARGETVAQLPTFAESFRSRRCLVPASGWFESTGEKRNRQGYHLGLKDYEPLAFAGVWTSSQVGDRFAIIMTQAHPSIAHVHERMPVIVPHERWRVWFADAPVAELEAMLEPLSGIAFHAVNPRTKHSRNDDTTSLEAVQHRFEGF